MSAVVRINVEMGGPVPGWSMVSARGCDQTMWQFVAPAFTTTHRSVLFDHVGADHSETTAYDFGKYALFDGSVDDILEIRAGLDLVDVEGAAAR